MFAPPSPSVAGTPPMCFFDGFYSNPDAVRAKALAAPFRGQAGAYTGTQARVPELDVAAIMRRIAQRLGRPIFYVKSEQGLFRSLTREQYVRKKKHVHVDAGMGFSGILCIGAHYEGHAWTSFHRHRDSGIGNVSDRAALAAAAARRGQSVRQLLAELDRDGGDVGRWDTVAKIDYAYNRLIVFDTELFHIAGEGFGDQPGNSKLTQNFTFYLRPSDAPVLRRLRLGSTGPLHRGPDVEY